MKRKQVIKLAIVAIASVGFVIPLAHAQVCTAPASGLVAWFPGDGNADDIQGDNNGTLQNGATFAPGEVDQAFSFNGVNQYVHVGGSLGINGNRTITAWVFVNPNGALGLPIITGGATGVGDFFGIAGTSGVCSVGQYELYVDHWGTPCYDSNIAVTPNAWNHVALTYDGTTLRFYVNGVAGTPVAGSLYNYNINSYDIGGNTIGGSSTKPSFNGLLDEVEIYNRVLSQAEVQAIFNAGSAGKCKPAIRPSSLPNGDLGSPYNQTITAAGGTGPYTYTTTNGSLPSGLTLSSAGVISGTPQTRGTFNFTVQVTDAASHAAQRNYSISISVCTPPPSGLVAWYPGDGNAVDIQGGNNGSLQGGATFATGYVGQAFSLNGTSAYVQAAAIAAQDPTTAGSLDAWVYLNQLPSQVGHAMSIIVKGGNTTDFNLQVFDSGSGDRFYLQIAANTNVPSTTIVQTGRWYHVAGTWDSTVGLKIYVNGVLENTNPALVTRGQSGQPMRIGDDIVFGPRLFNGLIDEPQIFNRALTASEVQAIFDAGGAGECKSPSPNFCGAISGQISDTQGTLAGALVQACEPNNGPCAFNATTNASGNYQITGLPLNTPFDLTVFPPSGSTDLPGELLSRSVQACGTPLTNQDVSLVQPAPPPPGTGIEPHRNGDGGVPSVYWQSPLTITANGTPNRTASYIVSHGTSIFRNGSMSESPGGSGHYVATISAFYPVHGPADLVITIDNITIGFDIYIDPSGTVQTSDGAPVSGATVTLFRSDSETGPFSIVPDGAAVMSPANRHNPDTTDALGHFGWDVLAGFYKVRAESAACTAPVETAVLQIPPPVTDLVLTLTCPTLSKPRIAVNPGGGFRVSFVGSPGQQYTVQYAPALPPLPITPNWQTLTLQTADANGMFSAVDTPSAGITKRFYRAILP